MEKKWCFCPKCPHPAVKVPNYKHPLIVNSPYFELTINFKIPNCMKKFVLMQNSLMNYLATYITQE